jgi:hypothetical protein
MTFLDEAILDAIEYASRKFQVLTGRTNVWLAVQLTNLSIVLYFIWAGVYFWKAELWLRISVGVFCAGIVYALTQTVFKESIEDSESNAYRRVAKGLRNPRRLRDAALRTSFLTLSILSFLIASVLVSTPAIYIYVRLRMPLVMLSNLLIVLTTALLYLLACDPLPPCAGKVREWLGTLQSASPRPGEETTNAASRVNVRAPAGLPTAPTAATASRSPRAIARPRRTAARAAGIPTAGLA